MKKVYKDELFEFLDNPFWLRPIEIELLNLIKEYMSSIEKESNIKIKNYLARLYKQNEKNLEEFASDIFLDELKKLF